MVLAGGLGTRIRHLVPEVPKPMAVVAGRPFLEHVMRYLASFGLSRVVLSTGYLSEVIEAHFARALQSGASLRVAREPEPLGTAGGFLHAARTEPVAPKAWLVLNGDSLVFADFARFIESFELGRWDAAVMGLHVNDALRFGTLETGPNGDLKRFAEKRCGAGLINAGVYLFRHSLLADFPGRECLSFETEVFPSLLARRARILVYAVDAPFLDIGTPESLAQADAFISKNFGALEGSVYPGS